MAVGNGVAPRGDVAVGIGADLDKVGVCALEGSTATGTPVGVCAGLAAVVGVGAGLGERSALGSSQATANAATARAVPSIRQRKMRQRVMDMSYILQRSYPYLVAEAGRLFTGAAGGMAASFPCVMAGVSASLVRPPFEATVRSSGHVSPRRPPDCLPLEWCRGRSRLTPGDFRAGGRLAGHDPYNRCHCHTTIGGVSPISRVNDLSLH